MANGCVAPEHTEVVIVSDLADRHNCRGRYAQDDLGFGATETAGEFDEAYLAQRSHHRWTPINANGGPADNGTNHSRTDDILSVWCLSTSAGPGRHPSLRKTTDERYRAEPIDAVVIAGFISCKADLARRRQWCSSTTAAAGIGAR